MPPLYHVSYEDARIVIIAGTFTFQGDQEFFDNRGIDMTTLVDMAAGFFDFILVVPRFYAKIIGNIDSILGSKGDGKGLGVFE